ncbi:MAG: ABC-F family ATP-binding cassette domain-containing protein [Lachnospiraceae bacterium]|nr:ABC-F family ATP-binding cassette domain-containing protein [Lachnospiraceae bacterium]
MLYRITDGTVTAGGVPVLSHIDFEIKGKEKVAVAGRNGAGKTTLLRLIAGELALDRDDKRMGPGITTSRRLTIGMLHQSSTLASEGEKTVEEILLEGCPGQEDFSRERFEYQLEYDRIFTGFGFQKSEKGRKFSSFSGGEQTKISLIRLLLQKPDILLLDEPTNHLDIPTTEWLEQYLKHYEKAVVLVSHDRFFLDQVADVVYELQNGKLRRYPGNYTHYREQKRKDLAVWKKAYERQQEEIQRLEGLVERFKHKPNKAAFARAKRKAAERIDRIEKPEEDEAHLFTGDITPLIPGSKWVLEAEHLKLGYDRLLLELSIRVRKGQKIGILGDNGAGKTTFLKTAAGLLPPLGGKCTLGNRTVMGYFDQHSAEIQSEKSVAEHFHDLFPSMTEKEVRQVLGNYLFPGRAAAKTVSSLSGGEKARLVLAELLQSRPNLLLLDEPTNHMDIPAKETLESAFQAYQGTILFISHDRYFIRQVADAILIFEGQSVMYYPFGYEHYLERCRRSEGESIAARIQAEEQALIAGIRAVPKAERHRLKEIGTEEAYCDWQLGLAGEALSRARAKVGQLWERQQEELERQRESQLELWDSEKMPEIEETITIREELESGQSDQSRRSGGSREEMLPDSENIEQAWNQWTESCLAWYDIWLECGPQKESYKG